MTKYRNKPLVVDAVKYDGEWSSLEPLYPVPDFSFSRNDKGRLFILALEGDMHADPGDYIIKGIAGELYPCKADIFKASYERVEG